jgi:DNA repair protein RecO
MLQKDQGVVLGISRSGETSLLVTFLGACSGKIRLVAKGVLSPRHATHGLLEPGNHVEVVYYYKEGRSAHYLREASRLSAPGAGRDSLEHMAVRLAAVELLDRVCYAGGPDEDIVAVAVDFLTCAAGDPLVAFLAFEAKLLATLGAAPDVTTCARCAAAPDGGAYDAREGASYCVEHAGGIEDALELSAEAAGLLRAALARPIAETAASAATRAARKQVGKILHWTYTLHVQGYRLPRSLDLLRSRN